VLLDLVALGGVDGGGYTAFAVTDEAAPGVVTSRNQPVAVGSLS